VILRYFALEYLSIGDTAVITYATPILVTVLAHFCLGEKAGIVPFIAAFITFGGVIAMTRPPFLTGQESFDQENLVRAKLIKIKKFGGKCQPQLAFCFNFFGIRLG